MADTTIDNIAIELTDVPADAVFEGQLAGGGNSFKVQKSNLVTGGGGGGYTTLEITTDNAVPYDVPNDGSYIIIVTTDGSGMEQVVNLTYPEPSSSNAYPQNYNVIVLLNEQVNDGDSVSVTLDGSTSGDVYTHSAGNNNGTGALSGQLSYSTLTLDYAGAAAKFILGLYNWFLDNDYDQNNKTVVWQQTNNGVRAIEGGDLTIVTVSTIGSPGSININGGDGVDGDANGAAINIRAGDPDGSGSGGTVSLAGGAADNADGAIIVLAGAQPNVGGNINGQAGAVEDGVAGAVVWAAGSPSAGDNNGGDVSTTPGASSGAGVNGVLRTGSPVADANGFILLQPSIVADLPDPTTKLDGTVAIVTDALLPAIGSVVVGGGAVRCMVNSDGAAWRVG